MQQNRDLVMIGTKFQETFIVTNRMYTPPPPPQLTVSKKFNKIRERFCQKKILVFDYPNKLNPQNNLSLKTETLWSTNILF